jgi:hypothetical protein
MKASDNECEFVYSIDEMRKAGLKLKECGILPSALKKGR